MAHTKDVFKKINGKITYLSPTVSSNGWGPGIVHATPITKQQYMTLDLKISEVSDAEDKDLLKLWPHRTRKPIESRNKTEEPLKEELERRGYTLGTDQKWIKVKSVTMNDLRNRGRSLIGTGNYCPECGGLCGNSNHDRKKW